MIYTIFESMNLSRDNPSPSREIGRTAGPPGR